jgi:hypothetical protein
MQENRIARAGRAVSGAQAATIKITINLTELILANDAVDGADGHADYLRFSWELGPEGTEAPIQGTDFAVVEAGRLARITGFLDRVPAE